MASLLDRIKGVESVPETVDGIPDEVPAEWSEGFNPDPVPGPAVKASPLTPKTSGNLTPALKKRLSAELEMYIEFMAMPVLMRDPTCGQAIHDQAAPIAAAVMQILSRHPELAHKFLATGNIGDWIKLAVALQPVGKVVWDHHIVKTGTEEQEPAGDFDLPAYRPGQ